MTVVLDSWAIIEYLVASAPAGRKVRDLLETERPTLSWINLGEVDYVLRRRQGNEAADVVVRELQRLVDAELPDEDRVLGAARIKSEFRMAYADAFAAATAIAHDAELWTGDPELLVDGAPWRWRDLRA